MAVNASVNRGPAARRISQAAISAPRMLMSWEDWLTFAAALIMLIAVGASIQQARWVRDMPPVIPTIIAGLVLGLLVARIRAPQILLHPIALALGAALVILAVQSYADGDTLSQRLSDVRLRMTDWWNVVRANEISNDRLPFILLVHAVCFVATYFATIVIYRFHNPWLAILPGGVVLLVNIALQNGQPVGALLVFLFGAVLLISRLYLQKNQARWKRDKVDYPEFISLSAAQLTLLLAMGLVIAAWLIPAGNAVKAAESTFDYVAQPFTGHSGAFNRLFNNLDRNGGGRLHNFGDYLTVRGNVKLGKRELYQVKAGEAGFVRGTSYDTYTGNGWKTGDRDDTKIEAGDLAPSPDAANYEKRVTAVLQVTVTDGDNTVLTEGSPIGTNVAVTAESPDGFRGDIEELSTRRGLNQGDTYNSIGSVSVATAEDLRSAGTDYPDWVTERYLQLPAKFPERVRTEAQRVVNQAQASTPYDRAVALESYLRTFPYNQAVPAAPHNRDIADYFLFDLKQGYFDYQATTMATMLRSIGVPARITVGYVLDPADANEGVYTVRKDDQYSWVEVFFPRFGWVTFNPTADRPAAGAEGALGTGGAGIDTPFVDPSLIEDIFGLDDLEKPEATDLQDALNEKAIANDGPPWTLIWALVGALVVLAASAFAGRLAWNWGLGGLTGPVRHWAQVQRFAGWAQLGSRRAETPTEFSRRVGASIEQPDAASQLARSYEAARYGRKDTIGETPAANDAYLAVRKAILPLAIKRRIPGRKEP